jgi:hypothetical protein
MRLQSFVISAIAFAALLIGPIFEGGAVAPSPPASPRAGLPPSPYLHQVQISSCTWFQRDVWVSCTQYSGCITWALCPYVRHGDPADRGCVCLRERPMGVRQEGRATATVDLCRTCPARCRELATRCFRLHGKGSRCEGILQRCLHRCETGHCHIPDH